MSEAMTREEYALNQQIIAEMGKETAIPPKVVDAQSRGWHNFVSCRRCGRTVSEAGDNYCSGCGQKIKHYTYAGTQGWNHKEAEKAWREMRKPWEKEKMA